MARQNAIDNFTQDLTIDPGASGDSFVQFNINATNKFRIGVDDTDSDAFVIAASGALGTTNAFRMSAAGERTLPLQPAFHAYLSATQTNVTGDGTAATVQCDTEVFDQNNDYDNTTYTFTAPISGKYMFNGAVLNSGITDASITAGHVEIVTSNTTFTGLYRNINALKNGSNELAWNMTVFAEMDAADTATLKSVMSGGTKVVDISLGSSETWFCGYLGV